MPPIEMPHQPCSGPLGVAHSCMGQHVKEYGRLRGTYEEADELIRIHSGCVRREDVTPSHPRLEELLVSDTRGRSPQGRVVLGEHGLEHCHGSVSRFQGAAASRADLQREWMTAATAEPRVRNNMMAAGM